MAEGGNLYIEEHGDQIGEKLLHRYEVYQNQIDEDPEFRKELEMEIGGFLLDMKEVIANDEKTRLLLEQVEGGHFDLPDETEEHVAHQAIDMGGQSPP